jgi:hypothetical protein
VITHTLLLDWEMCWKKSINSRNIIFPLFCSTYLYFIYAQAHSADLLLITDFSPLTAAYNAKVNVHGSRLSLSLIS